MNHLNYTKWLQYNYTSVQELYEQLINANTIFITPQNCTLTQFCQFCYRKSSKEKYKYITIEE